MIESNEITMGTYICVCDLLKGTAEYWEGKHGTSSCLTACCELFAGCQSWSNRRSTKQASQGAEGAANKA